MQNTGSGGQIKFELTAGSGLAAMTCSGSELLKIAMHEPLDEPSAQSRSIHCDADQPDGLRPLPESQCMSQMRPERQSSQNP